jgi:amino-acid N-acetyltransferase
MCCPPQEARQRGIDRLVLLTTRTADWFTQRDFKPAGPAWCSELLPAARRARINPARNSQLYVKPIVQLSKELLSAPGKRIGF